MPKKKHATYISVKEEAATRLRALGFAIMGTQVPANRQARREYAHSHNTPLPPPIFSPKRKEKNAT